MAEVSEDFDVYYGVDELGRRFVTIFYRFEAMLQSIAWGFLAAVVEMLFAALPPSLSLLF